MLLFENESLFKDSFGLISFLLHAPLKQTAGVGFWLLQLELHSLGLHWVEIHDAGYTTLAWISIGSRNFLPVACLVLIVEFPAVWHLATAPRLVVVPIYGTGLDLLALREGVGNPFCGVLLWPPVDVWDRTVVFIGRNQSVGDTALGWHWRREFYLSLCSESCRS